MVKAKRESISKSVRFEVLKRDKFTCQYCGESAPKVLLQIDHIKPVAKGGNNKVINLITSCFDCNAGKSDKELSDDSKITKQKAQLDILQERRDQLEMMMQWHEGLQSLDDDIILKVKQYWNKATGYNLTESGTDKLKQLFKKFELQEILRAIDVATNQYLKSDNHGITQESVDIAFNKIGGIITIEKKSQEEPDLKDLFYIRGILKNRFSHKRNFIQHKALTLLKEARGRGVPIDKLKNMAISMPNYFSFEINVESLNQPPK